jgi:hypothetical protein
MLLSVISELPRQLGPVLIRPPSCVRTYVTQMASASRIFLDNVHAFDGHRRSGDRHEVALRNPVEVYSGRRRPFDRSCRHYFRIAALPDLRSAGRGPRKSEYRSKSEILTASIKRPLQSEWPTSRAACHGSTIGVSSMALLGVAIRNTLARPTAPTGKTVAA